MTPSALTAILLVSAFIRLTGELMKANKDRKGWLVCIASALLGLVWSVASGALALSVTGVATILVSVAGYTRWARIQDERKLEIHRLKNEIAARDAQIYELTNKP